MRCPFTGDRLWRMSLTSPRKSGSMVPVWTVIDLSRARPDLPTAKANTFLDISKATPVRTATVDLGWRRTLSAACRSYPAAPGVALVGSLAAPTKSLTFTTSSLLPPSELKKKTREKDTILPRVRTVNGLKNDSRAKKVPRPKEEVRGKPLVKGSTAHPRPKGGGPRLTRTNVPRCADYC